MKGYVYVLVCPKMGKAVYVGSTTKDPSYRLRQHVRAVKKYISPLYDYFRNNRLSPTMEVIAEIENFSTEELRAMEYKLIQSYISKGYKLFNKHCIQSDKELSSIRIDADIYEAVKSYCIEHGAFIGKFFEIAAKEKLERERQQKEQQKETK